MKIRLLFIIVYSVQILLADMSHTQALNSPESIIKKTITDAMHKYKIPGVAVVLYTHDMSFALHAGYADSQKKTPITQDTLFEIGSITKLFTCLLIAQEVLQGTMKLSDPIIHYIPELKVNKKLNNMTLLKLATHTSTMPFNVPNHVISQKDFVSYMSHWQPAVKQYIWWQYSNPGIELLRIALEETLQQNINTLLSERVLKPLGMSAIGMHVPEYYKAQCATCYDKVGNKTIGWDDPLLLGSAAIRATSVDMLKFLKAAIGVQGPPHIKQAMQLTQTPYIIVDAIKHGLGWEINDLTPKPASIGNLFKGYPAYAVQETERIFNPNVLLDKEGTTNGFHAYIGVIPSKNSGVVVMINRRLVKGLDVIKKMGRDILLQAVA